MSLRLATHATLSDGRVIRILCGAEGTNDDGSNDENKNDEGGTDNGGAGDGGNDDGDSGAGATVSLEELEKIRARMQAADRRASEYERKIREYEDKDKTTQQRLEGQVESLTAENQKLREELKGSRRDNAFLTTNGVTWHDAKLALSKIDWDSVTDSDSGEVNTSALKKEIERIAKESPFLVKAQSSGSGSGGGGTGKQGPSGHHPGGSGGDKNNADRAALEKKYPALRR